MRDLDGEVVKTIPDILSHYVRRAAKNKATKGAMDNLPRFSKFLKTLPVKQERFASFFNEENNLRLDLFDQLWSCKDDTKSPGAPLYFVAPTNKSLESQKAEIYDVVNDRVAKIIALGKHLHETKMIGVPATEEERSLLITNGIMDVMAVGLKNEARPLGKMPRLITLTSVVDNLVTRIGYHNLLQEINNSPEKYMVASLDIVTQAKTKERFDVLKSRGKQTGNDVQGWEYSMNETDQWAAMYADAYMLGLIDSKLNVLPRASPTYFHFLVGYTYTLINRSTLLDNGQIVLLPAGIMPSGVLITFERNSISRANLSDNVSTDNFQKPVEHCMTAGDDCVDSNNFTTVEESKAAHLPYGKVVTDVENYEDEFFEFCSTRFTANGSYQLNIEKTAYNLLIEKRVGEAELEQFRLAYYLHPDYSRVLAELLLQARQ